MRIVHFASLGIVIVRFLLISDVHVLCTTALTLSLRASPEVKIHRSLQISGMHSGPWGGYFQPCFQGVTIEEGTKCKLKSDIYSHGQMVFLDTSWFLLQSHDYIARS